MFVPAWATRLAPYVGVALLILGAYLWAYDNGRDAERAKWEKVAAEAAQKQRAREVELQEQVNAAGTALSVLTSENERLEKRATGSVRNYYVSRPADNLVCLADERVQHIQATDAAAIEAAGPAR